MLGRIANLYAEKALNDNLLAVGMISPEMHRRASESILLDIDNCSRKSHACDGLYDRSKADGYVERPAASG